MKAGFTRREGRIFLEMTLTNQGQSSLVNFLLKFNKNTFNITPENEAIPLQLMPGQSMDYSQRMTLLVPPQQSPLTNMIQAGLQHQGGRFFFNIPLPLHVVFQEEGRLDKSIYLNMWRTIPTEKSYEIKNLVSSDVNLLLQKLESYNVFFIAKSKNPDSGKEFVYLSVKLMNDVVMLLEFNFNGNMCSLCVKTQGEGFVPMLQSSIEYILQRP